MTKIVKSVMIFLLVMLTVANNISIIVLAVEKSIDSQPTVSKASVSITWAYNSSTHALTLSGSGDMSDYSNFNVAPWLQHKDEIESIILSDSITSIGNYAFAQCRYAVSVTLPSNLKRIGNQAFYECNSLSTLIFSNKLESIGDYSFYDCYELSSVKLGTSVKSIGIYAFAQCTSLASLFIPLSVTSIGNSAFNWCYDLVDVYYSGSNSQWNAISIGSNNTYLTTATIHYNSSGPVIIPVTGVTLSAESFSLIAGESASPAVMVEPTDATNKSVTWSSSNEDVATVDANGLVTAKKPGTATITVTANDTTNGIISDTCEVKVVEKKAIIVLPGYMGSRLFTSDDSEIWVNTDAIKDDILKYILPGGKKSSLVLDEDGTGSKVDVDMSKDFYGTEDKYKTLMTMLVKKFSTKNGGDYDVIFFPFNWLGDLNESRIKLENYINDKGYDKIVFVTHSTGGLLASAYISASSENKRKIEHAILLAAPIYGTYSALEPIETGNTPELSKMLEDRGIPNTLGVAYPAIHRWVKAVTRNSPTTYQLLPSVEYLKMMPVLYSDEFSGEAVVSSTDYYSILNNSSNINNLLANGSNSRSHNYFRETALKNNVLSELKQVDTYLIYSSEGFSTPAIACYKTNSFTGKSKLDDIIYKKDGDGTVMGISASAGNTSQVTTIDCVDQIAHGDLVSEKEPLGYIEDIINGTYEASTSPLNLKTSGLYDSAGETTGMSEQIKFKIESSALFNVKVYSASNVLVAEVTDGVSVGFDGNEMIYKVLSDIDDEYSSIMYVPMSDNKVEFISTVEETTYMDFNVRVSTLTSDGYKVTSGVYSLNDEISGTIMRLDLSGVEDHIDNLANGICGEAVYYNTEWQVPKTIEINGIGNTKRIEVIGADASYRDKLNWTSLDEEVVTVSDTGEISSISSGNTTIYVTDGNKIEYISCIVTDEDEPSSIASISLTPEIISIHAGETSRLTATVSPSDATNKSLTWSSSNEDVATVDANGLVTAKNPGTATITATANDTTNGVIFDTCEVTVTPVTLEGIALNTETLSLQYKSTYKLTVTFNPANATNKKITWTSSNEKVAIVDQSGNVTAVGKGTANITATTEDGGKTANCTVTVKLVWWQWLIKIILFGWIWY